MNHGLLQMLEEAGFAFTPDVMAKLPEFEKLITLERQRCIEVCESVLDQAREGGFGEVWVRWCIEAIKRGVNTK